MIRVGTCSWTDESLIKSGDFYPKGVTSAEARLRFYALHFSCAEVDSSYYALPSAANAALWAQRTPDAFRFNVKAYRAMTGHQVPIRSLPKDLQGEVDAKGRQTVAAKDLPPSVMDAIWSRFLRALEPLREAGKLTALHFQLAPWIHATPKGYELLEEVRSRAGDHLVSVEFRHESWFDTQRREAVLKFLADRRFVNTTVDEPQGPSNSIPQIWTVTNPRLAILRLHGRNLAKWNIKDAAAASDRFDYDYPDFELETFVRPLHELESEADEVHVLFNNNNGSQAQRNAATLSSMLGQPVSWSPPRSLFQLSQEHMTYVPTAEGVRRYPESAGFVLVDALDDAAEPAPCTCAPSCHARCAGECGCTGCGLAFTHFLDEAGLLSDREDRAGEAAGLALFRQHLDPA